MVRHLAAAILLAAAVPVSFPAEAQVYKWVDANGKVHYSSTPPPATASSAQPVEERISVMDGMRPEERAAAERRFATRAAEEERAWQERQRAQAAQASSPPAADNDPRSNYREPYYYDYGGGYIPGPIRRPGARPPRVTHHSAPPSSRGSGSLR